MSLANITLDDFACSQFEFSSNWNVPDSQHYGESSYKPTTFINSLVDGTYHQTNFLNAFFAITFTGPSIAIYGLSGPLQGSYSVKLSYGNTTIMSAYALTNSSNHLLFSAYNLNSSQQHAVQITNLGANGAIMGGNSLLVDYAIMSSTVGALGSGAFNTTIEDNDHKNLQYTGSWLSNNDSRFSGGTSTYTNVDGASVSFTFNGSQVFIFGDTVSDHGTYQINLDNFPSVQYNAKTENLKINTLKYFMGGLNSSTHTLKITNIGTTYFDLDRIIYTTPSAYFVPNTTSLTTPTNTTNATTTSNSSSSIFSATLAMPQTSIVIIAPSAPSAAATTSTTPKSSANSSNRFSYRLLSILGFFTVLIHCV